MAYLTKERQREIDNVIDAVKDFSDDCYYPLVSLGEMAEGQGIKIAESDLTDMIPGRRLSGLIIYDDPEKQTHPRILVEAAMTPERKKFTLAHELGHHFLHKGEKFRLDDFDYSVDSREKQEESEANYFAASLLMPADPLIRRIGEGKTIGEIAKYFGVSLAAVKNRIRWVSGE